MRKVQMLIALICIGSAFTAYGKGGKNTTGALILSKTFQRDLAFKYVPQEGEEEEMEEEEKAFPLTFGFDLVSRYVWRGVDFGATPAFQPGLAYSVGNDFITWEIGAWASWSVTGAFAENDIYTTLSFPYVWIGMTDYFFPNEGVGEDSYFVYDDGTGHVFEVAGGVDGPEKVPFSAFFAYNFHAADPALNPASGKHDIYFEVGYGFSLKHDVGLDLFVGGANGPYYTQNGGFGIVNVGLTASKSFVFGKKHTVSLPLSVSLITNPEAQKFHFVAAVGLWNQ